MNNQIKEIINSRFIERIYPSKEALEKILASGKKLSIYIGIDPTSPHLHLGHSTNFFVLKKFQKLGHKVIFLIGDFTARIGDPTGKVKTRRPLTQEEVAENAKGYRSQASKILDFDSKENPVEIKFNSQWLAKLTLEDVIKLLSKTTISQMIERDMFKERIKKDKEIYLHEFIYPLLQGYDSVVMNVDIEIGGNDQTFNMMVGRDLVKHFLKKEKFVITTKLLINPKTQKKLMSKSEGHYIALDDEPNEMYGKVMNLPDEVIQEVFSLCTELKDEEINSIEESLKNKKLKPQDAKAILAFEIVKLYYGEQTAKKAKEEFFRVFKEKKLPEKFKEFKVDKNSINIIDALVLTGLASSKSEAKRLIQQKAIKIDNNLIEEKNFLITLTKKGNVLKKGKRFFAKIIKK